MNEEDRERLGDMLGRAEAARRYLGSAGAAELAINDEKAVALLHSLQIIGEAANHVTQQTRSAIVDLPWADIVGLRNRIVHDYRTIRYDIVVKTIREDLPELIDTLKRVLGIQQP